MGAPSGTVTFLFTDIEGSTGLWESAPDAMRTALARHDAIVRGAVEANGGYVFATGGDGFAAAFGRAGEALAAAVEAQTALSAEPWAGGVVLRVRMGLHTGEVEERDGDYFGPAVNRAARIMAAGHGAQVLVSATTAALLGGAALSDLGEHSFAGLDGPERVFQTGDREFPPLRALGGVPSNLPAERSVFIGRERELGVVAGLLRSSRVVTLTGVGGVGKTRLAVQTAAGLLGEFPGGVWLVELAPLIDGALVATTVASSIGAPVSRGVESPEVVCRFLAQRRALVVLDNCEHVIGDAANLVDRVLEAAPRAKILTTSREPLDVRGERVWRVPSLTIEADRGAGDAVALFAERAAQVQPGFTLHDGATRSAAVAVCQRLDGIPLAIELAAARAKLMSVEQISTRLDERFRLLARGSRSAVPRQQTLQGAVDWSYELLVPAERALFDTLGVFAGDFDLSAISGITGKDDFEVLDLVDQLVDKSMVEADPARDRYRLLETLRQYAWDRLGASGGLAATRDAHAAYFSSLAAEQAALMGVSGRQVEALDRLGTDYDNLRAALAHLIATQQAEAAARLVRRLVGLFNIRHPREGFAWFEQVLALADQLPSRTRSRVLGDTAHAAMNAGDGAAQREYAQEAIDIGGDDAPAAAYWLLCQGELVAGNYREAVEHARRGVAIAAATGDVTTRVIAAGGMILALAWLGEGSEARGLIPEVIASAEELGNPTITGASYLIVGEALVTLGAPDEAVAMLERGLNDSDAGGPVMACDTRSLYSLLTTDAHEAAAILRPAIRIAKDQLSGYHQIQPLMPAVKVLANTNRGELAARLLGAYRSKSTGVTWSGRWHDRLVNHLRGQLGSDAFDSLLREGGRLTPAQALQLADEALSDNL